MSIKQVAPNLWRLDVRAWKDGKEYRRREDFQGGRKDAEFRYHEIRRELQGRAESRIIASTINGMLRTRIYTLWGTLRKSFHRSAGIQRI